MTSNYFESLPDDLQDKIYRHTHELQSKEIFKKIQLIDFWKRDDWLLLSMNDLLYNLGATKMELRDYYFCLDWLDGRKLDIEMEDIIENKYYNIWSEYWYEVAEGEYYSGDYI
jgi:hypothetical protein